MHKLYKLHWKNENNRDAWCKPNLESEAREKSNPNSTTVTAFPQLLDLKFIKKTSHKTYFGWWAWQLIAEIQ